jgi:hypothetical protein
LPFHQVAFERDLQFWIKFVGDLNANALRAAEEIFDQSARQAPDFLAITGDVAERGHPAEYEQAIRWFEYFVKRLHFPTFPTNRILIVPGNHDYCLPFAVTPRIRAKTSGTPPKLSIQFDKAVESDASHLQNFAFRPYSDFIDRVCDCPWIEKFTWLEESSLAWIETRFRHLGIVFYGINTNSPISANGLSGKRMNEAVLTRVQERLLDIINATPHRLTVFGLGHHNPLGGEGGVENPTALANFFASKARTSAFLFGDIHNAELVAYEKPGEYRLILSSASTLTLPGAKRPQDTLRGFSLINCTRKDGLIVNVDVRQYNWLNRTFTPGKSISKEIDVDSMPKN